MMMILSILLSLLVLLLLVAALKPDDFRVERSTTIRAPAEAIAALIDDFHQWTKWSPWEGKDPSLKRTYEGAARGVGAKYGWEGNNQVGTGRMEILTVAPEKITIKLEFLKPFTATNTAEFTFTKDGDGTRVTWAMIGKSPFPMKVMSIFMDMDEMTGKDFVAGLANMKSAAEKA